MKIIFLILTIALLFISSGTYSQLRIFTGADSVITVSEGENFTIMMASNPSTGYSWHINFIDKDMLNNTGKDYKGSNDNKPGSGGEETWFFEAVKKGETKLVFFYSRSMDISEKDTPLTFTINIK